MHVFRLGQFLIAGTVIAENRPFLTVEVRRRIVESASIPVVPVKARISQAFEVSKNFDLDNLAESDQDPESFSALVHEALVPFVSGGREALGGVSLKGYSRSRGVVVEGKDEWLPLHDLLSNVQIGQTLALEALRPRLIRLGLFEGVRGEPITEGYTDIKTPVNVYMKAEPFRDITSIKEGTSVGVIGYYKGCAVVEADGEMFWRPIEEASFYDDDYKDDQYYFNQDSNQDKIQDPLQSLPSKTALAGTPSRPQDNWNSSPNLVKVSGHFSPIHTIRNDDYSVLGESYIGTHGFEDDERQQRPKLHDISAEPGLEPTDDPVEESEQKTVWNPPIGMKVKHTDSQGLSPNGVVVKNFPEREASQVRWLGGKITMAAWKVLVSREPKKKDKSVKEAVLDAISEGADLDHILASMSDPKETDRAYNRALAQIFPVE